MANTAITATSTYTMADWETLQAIYLDLHRSSKNVALSATAADALSTAADAVRVQRNLVKSSMVGAGTWPVAEKRGMSRQDLMDLIDAFEEATLAHDREVNFSGSAPVEAAELHKAKRALFETVVQRWRR